MSEGSGVRCRWAGERVRSSARCMFEVLVYALRCFNTPMVLSQSLAKDPRARFNGSTEGWIPAHYKC